MISLLFVEGILHGKAGAQDVIPGVVGALGGGGGGDGGDLSDADAERILHLDMNSR